MCNIAYDGLKAIVVMCWNDITIVAEKVESIEELRILYELWIHHWQWWLFWKAQKIEYYLWEIDNK